MDDVPNDFEIDGAGLDGPPASTYEAVYALVDGAAAVAGKDFADILAKIRRHNGHVARICPGPTNQDGRRRLRNTLLKTTYPREVIGALRAQVLGYRQELRKSLPDVMALAIKLEEAELHLIEAYRLENEKRQEQAEGEDTGLYPAVKDAAKQMYDRYGVKHWHWAAADAERLERIAEILWEPIARAGE